MALHCDRDKVGRARGNVAWAPLLSTDEIAHMPAGLFWELLYAELPHLLEISFCLVAIFSTAWYGVDRVLPR